MTFPGNGQLGVRDAKDNFFNGVPEGLINTAVSELKDQARQSAVTECGPPAWSDKVYDGRRAYAFCELDKAIPPFAQDAMIKGSAVPWDVQNFETGHAPFLSQYKSLSAWTISEISKFQGADARIFPILRNSSSLDVTS